MATIPHRPRPEKPEREAAQSAASEGFAQLLDSYSGGSLHDGELLKGRVLQVTDNEVIVDVGYKCEGLIPIHQFRGRESQTQVKPGDVIDVTVERASEREGYVLLSFEKAQRIRVWEVVEKAFNDQSPITGRVVERVKGGLAVDLGVR